MPEELSEKARKLEEKHEKNNIIFLSPLDLFELISGSMNYLLKKWSDDYQSNQIDFKNRIQNAINIVAKYGAVLVPDYKLEI